MKYTKQFKELSKEDAPVAGGKGASLGEMLNAGIPVPDGYVVTADTFETFLANNGLTAKIEEILDGVNSQDIKSVEEASQRIQSLIQEAHIPEDIAKEVEIQFRALETPFVAVRSSATAEDGADHAWAGQLSSYLNVKGDELLNRIQSCWASLFTPRAIFYRFEKKLHTTHISVAVVVQKMVNSEKSGIAFSVHPVTEDYNQMIIEAGFGLGEAIVSGSITPDSYIITKEPLKITDINVAEQTKALYRDENGGNVWKELGAKGIEQVLSEKEIIELAKLIKKIEDHYGFPVDVEWAFENGKFYITQSRPITTLKNNKVSEDRKDENISRVLKRFLEYKGNKEAMFFRGHYSPLFATTSWFADNSDVVFYEAYKDGEALLATRIDIYRDLIAGGTFLRYLEGKFNLEEFKKQYTDYHTKIVSLYKEHIISDFSKQSEEKLLEILHSIQEVYEKLANSSIFIELLDMDTVRNTLSVMGIPIENLNLIFEHASKPPYDSLDKRHRAEKIRIAQQSLSRENIRYAKYLYTDYFSTKGEDEIREDLLNYKSEEVGEFEELNEDILITLSEEEKKVFRYIRYITHLRDYRKDDFAMCQALIYALGEEIAARANLNGYLHYILLRELVNGVSWLKSQREEILKREEGFEFIYGRGYFDVLSNGEISLDSIQTLLLDERQKDFLQGEGASSGKVRGRVRIVKNAHEDGPKLRDGEILVTGMTRPEFVPFLKKVAAIITDEGGITSHAAIVSRELSIPCIIGTKSATHILKDGDFVEVDADNGMVKIIKRA